MCPVTSCRPRPFEQGRNEQHDHRTHHERRRRASGVAKGRQARAPTGIDHRAGEMESRTAAKSDGREFGRAVDGEPGEEFDGEARAGEDRADRAEAEAVVEEQQDDGDTEHRTESEAEHADAGVVLEQERREMRSTDPRCLVCGGKIVSASSSRVASGVRPWAMAGSMKASNQAGSWAVTAHPVAAPPSSSKAESAVAQPVRRTARGKSRRKKPASNCPNPARTP